MNYVKILRNNAICRKTDEMDSAEIIRCDLTMEKRTRMRIIKKHFYPLNKAVKVSSSMHRKASSNSTLVLPLKLKIFGSI